MNTKTVKEKVITLVYKYEAYKLSMSDLIDSIEKLYREEICTPETCPFAKNAVWGMSPEGLENMRKKHIKNHIEVKNEMPPTILDDDIADWEHDNLVKNG